MDDAIGRILQALDRAGQTNNTLVLFTSDNGGQKDYASKTEYEGKHGPYPTLGDNRPLAGWKGQLYEGGIRVPALVSWPGRLQPGAIEQTLSYLDWFPTLAGRAGVAPRAEWKLEGRDVWPILTRQKDALRVPVLYWNTGNTSGVLAGDWKLIVAGKKPARELYNLADDPAEKQNRAEDSPAKLEELGKLLQTQKKLDP
jgi:arylsulfatase A-like enzyme